MIEHHYTVIYNSSTGNWYWDKADYYTNGKEGNCYDTSTGKFFMLDPDNPAHDDFVEADLNAYTALDNFIKNANDYNDAF